MINIIYTSKAIRYTVNDLNKELRNIIFWKLFRNRKIELKVDVSDLKEHIHIANKKLIIKHKFPSEIKKHKIYDLKQFWISTIK